MEPIARLMAVALVVAPIAACVSKPPPPTVRTSVVETATGAGIVEIVRIAATVAGINYDTREIVLLGPAGNRVVYKVDQRAVTDPCTK